MGISEFHEGIWIKDKQTQAFGIFFFSFAFRLPRLVQSAVCIGYLLQAACWTMYHKLQSHKVQNGLPIYRCHT